APRAAACPITAPIRPRQAQLHGNHFPQCRSSFVFRSIVLAVDIECVGLPVHGVRNRQRRRLGSSGSHFGSRDHGANRGRHSDGTHTRSFNEISARIFHLQTSLQRSRRL